MIRTPLGSDHKPVLSCNADEIQALIAASARTTWERYSYAGAGVFSADAHLTKRLQMRPAADATDGRHLTR